MATIDDKDLEKIKHLYYEDGFSMQAVANECDVEIGAVMYFMRRHCLKRRTSNESNSINFEKCEPSFRLAKMNCERLRALQIAGTMLYWGEGHKVGKSASVDFANSDKDMIILFLKFLRKVCGVDEKRLRVYPYLYANQDVESCIEFWSKITKIDKTQFTKPYIRQDFNEKKTGKMPYGLVHIRYSDKKLLDQIKNWIEEYRNL